MFVDGCGRGGGSGAEADVASGTSIAGQSVRVGPVGPRGALEVEVVFHCRVEKLRATRVEDPDPLETEIHDKAACSISMRSREVMRYLDAHWTHFSPSLAPPSLAYPHLPCFSFSSRRTDARTKPLPCRRAFDFPFVLSKPNQPRSVLIQRQRAAPTFPVQRANVPGQHHLQVPKEAISPRHTHRPSSSTCCLSLRCRTTPADRMYKSRSLPDSRCPKRNPPVESSPMGSSSPWGIRSALPSRPDNMNRLGTWWCSRSLSGSKLFPGTTVRRASDANVRAGGRLVGGQGKGAK